MMQKSNSFLSREKNIKYTSFVSFEEKSGNQVYKKGKVQHMRSINVSIDQQNKLMHIHYAYESLPTYRENKNKNKNVYHFS